MLLNLNDTHFIHMVAAAVKFNVVLYERVYLFPLKLPA